MAETPRGKKKNETCKSYDFRRPRRGRRLMAMQTITVIRVVTHRDGIKARVAVGPMGPADMDSGTGARHLHDNRPGERPLRARDR